MKLKEIITIHIKRLDNLAQEDYNQNLFYFGVACLCASIFMAYKYHIGFIILGLLIYGICAYKSVKW